MIQILFTHFHRSENLDLVQMNHVPRIGETVVISFDAYIVEDVVWQPTLGKVTVMVKDKT